MVNSELIIYNILYYYIMAFLWSHIDVLKC